MGMASGGIARRSTSPLFNKYVLSGKTYVTANGAVVPNELQYYDGEMVHFYGECANVPAVNEALTGSGYKAITLRYLDGSRTAVAQVWSNKFTDTTIGPYSAMFIVVMVVPDGAPPERACIRAHPNGASSVLAILDGTFDPQTAVYVNRAQLFMVRLLDTTQVAIDVGRERMGTDKRPGTVDMSRSGRRIRIAIADQNRRGVVNADLELASDLDAYMPEVARAAKTAGIELRSLPRNTECVYPAVARIGRGPIVSWQWRSTATPQLQPVVPGTVAFDSSSEEGRLLRTWSFTPKVFGYFPNVQGLVAGLADPTPLPSPTHSTAPIATIQRSGLSLDPASAMNSAVSSIPLLRTVLAGDIEGVVPQLPVLRLVPEGISSGLSRLASSPGVQAQPHVAAAAAEPAVAGQPRWGWDTRFLGSLTASLRKEVVGETPDGLRINWHVTTGSFVGPGLDATILPGAADWMRIRRDGVAIVNVQACFETQDGARVFGSYSGIFDLGPQGYERALREEYDPLPPVVVTPTYATADPRLAWLNRAQCVGVGRVDMAALRVEFDVYAVRVADRLRATCNAANTSTQSAAPTTGSLYMRLGGNEAIVGITQDFVEWSLADKHLGRFFPGVRDDAKLKALNERIVEFLCSITGGPCAYKGRDMKTAHKGLRINDDDWQIGIDLFSAALQKHHVSPAAHAELMRMIEEMKADIVEVPGRA